MTCQEFLARYSEFLDELLDPMEVARWRHHLGRCASCARYDRVVRQGLELVRGLPRIEPSPEFEPRLQHRLFHLRDETAGERASGASGLVALAIAGMLAAIAWSPLLRPDPFTIELPAVRARAPGAAPRAAAPEPFALPATWPQALVAEGNAWASDAFARWWWDHSVFGPVAGGRVFDFVHSRSTYSPGPHSPLMVDRPDYGHARPAVFDAAAPGGSGATLGRE